MPASSRTSRSAVTSGVSPGSTIPFGSCQRRFSPTFTIAISTRDPRRRNATPPALVCVFVGIVAISRFADQLLHHGEADVESEARVGGRVGLGRVPSLDHA